MFFKCLLGNRGFSVQHFTDCALFYHHMLAPFKGPTCNIKQRLFAIQLIHTVCVSMSVQFSILCSSVFHDILISKWSKRRIWDQLGLQKTWIVCGMFHTIGDVSPFISILQQYIQNAFILLSLSKEMDCENVSERSKKPHQNIKQRESLLAQDVKVNSHWKLFACFPSWEVATCWYALHATKKCFASRYSKWDACNNCKNWQWENIEQQFSSGHVMTEREQIAKVRWHLC